MEHGFACKNTENLMTSPLITFTLLYYLFPLPIAIGRGRACPASAGDWGEVNRKDGLSAYIIFLDFFLKVINTCVDYQIFLYLEPR